MFGGNPLTSCQQHRPNPSPFDVPQGTQYEQYGDHKSGAIITTSFCFDGFGGVPGQAPDLSIVYDFVNQGYAGSPQYYAKQVSDWISTLGGGIAGGLAGNAAGWSQVNDAHHALNDALFGSCDGPVAGDAILVKSDILAQVTNSTGTYSETRFYTGTDSPWNCGEVSHYQVTFTFSRLSMLVGRRLVP